MALSVGSPAPDFTLTHKVRQDPITLSRHASDQTAVLLFFPLAFSGVCTEEMCHIAETYERWETVGAKVLGISVDSPFVNAKFAEETGVPFPLLSDFNREVCHAYGVRNDDFFGMKGVADRSAFVIDPSGRVSYAWTSADADVMPPFDVILEAVESANQVPRRSV